MDRTQHGNTKTLSHKSVSPKLRKYSKLCLYYTCVDSLTIYYKLSNNNMLTVIKIFQFSTIQTAMNLKMLYNTALQLQIGPRF